jgi:hypothetical protein
MANIKDFIKKIGNSAVSLEEQQQALAQVEQTIIEAKQKRTEAVGKNADMVIQALKTIEAKLEAKLTELNNTPAKQGIQGPTGKAGKDGKDGQAGRDGINGKDGTDGKDGVDGKDGISVVDAKIDFDGSLVVYLSNGNEIDCGQILQPEVARNIIISSGGSGTSQVVTDTLVSLQNQINTLTGIDGVLGTMAQQDANAVAVTGGTINGTTIGATTPSTVNATTITGQTGVLRGTGQNLLLQSGWAGGTSGTVGSGAVAPTSWSFVNTGGTVTYASALSGSGNSIRFTATGAERPAIQQTLPSNFIVGGVYSLTVNVETITSGTVTLSNIFSLLNTTATYLFYVNGVSVSGSTLVTSNSKIQYVFTVSAISGSSVVRLGLGVAGAVVGDVTLANPQLEIGSIANTYIPTTTTAVYGTPTLSFSGVSEIGLLSTGALYLQPAGTGALQAQATTSTTAGGNARGANAVDWQTSRSGAAQVASVQFSVIGGGTANTSNGFNTTVAGGNGNTASGSYGFVGGGLACTATRDYAVSIGGQANTATGNYNFIGGGFTNSGTANAAVTTQSGTMNATTAVTLSGSNANIKVGQLISGTSIAGDTYVAAISGTSLTLSKVASGSSTSTLSFFTPHGVVVGGGNNQATGSYSFIGGGGDAGTSANRNVASGDWSFVGGGAVNQATGIGSAIVGGGTLGAGGVAGNTASGSTSFIGAGFGNISSAISSSVLGARNTASGDYSTCLGRRGTTRGIQGNTVFSACFNPIVDATGVSQTALLVLARQTTDATATALTSDANAASGTNQVILPNNSAYFFRGEVVSGVTGGGNTKGWTIEGVIKRGANAASTALVGTPTVTSSFADAGASTWVIAVTADTTNGGLRVTFTGQASTTIRTVCQIRTTEMTF